MGFSRRKRIHDQVLREALPKLFRDLGIKFERRGYEVTMAKDKLLITQLEDTTSQSVRFTPDGIAVPSDSYLVELKTKLPEQESPNYDFEMAPWEKGMEAHRQGNLVAYIFWPDTRVCWVSDAKPDWIGVPKWRWNEQDYLRVKHRYNSMCPVYHTDVEGGSGTIFGVIRWERVRAMQPFEQFWLEVLGKWHGPKQLKLV